MFIIHLSMNFQWTSEKLHTCLLLSMYFQSNSNKVQMRFPCTHNMKLLISETDCVQSPWSRQHSANFVLFRITPESRNSISTPFHRLFKIVVYQMECDKTRWFCSQNSDQNFTQKSTSGTVFKNWTLCSYFHSYFKKSSNFYPLWIFVFAFWCHYCQLSKILGQSEVSDNMGFCTFDRQVAHTMAALFFGYTLISSM